MDLFDIPPAAPSPATNDRSIARIIAHAIFPCSFHESEKVRAEAALGVPIERHQFFQIERCLPVVKALREEGLLIVK